jgi:hypothetical protein
VSDHGVLGRLEALVDSPEVAERLARIENALPIEVRPRQLGVPTLFLGMLLALSDSPPAHLGRVHQALLGLDEETRRRLGVVVAWKTGPHTLTYRQAERTFALVAGVLAKSEPDGTPTCMLQELCDSLLEASVVTAGALTVPSSSSLAVDWTDVESFSTRRTKPDGRYADQEAAWGHRKGGDPGEKDELFLGYYLSLATMVPDDNDTEIPELVRRMQMGSCDHDPVPPTLNVLVEMPKAGIFLGDVMADSGYAHRVPAHFALPLRAAGATLVIDLHPSDRGMQGTHAGAICHNGNLYCPSTPTALFDIGPLDRGASQHETATHDQHAGELASYKLRRLTANDKDGYHRVACPAAISKVRCPLRESSMSLDYTLPEVLCPPEHPPICCTPATITVPPSVNAKTAQRHDYPGKS